MDISLIVLIGFPILYLTGNLRKATAAAGIRGSLFILYFAVGLVLALVPPINFSSMLAINVSGAFLCIAPAVYSGLQGGFGFRFFLASAITVLLSVTSFFVSNTLTLPYLTPVLGLMVSAVAVLCFGRRSPEHAPVLVGLFGVVDCVMALLSDTANTVTLFDIRTMAMLSLAVCLGAAFLTLRRPRGRHAVGCKVPPEARV